MRIDRPAEGDSTPLARPESHATDSPPAAGHEQLDRAAYTASYQETVDAADHNYRIETAEAADRDAHEGLGSHLALTALCYVTGLSTTSTGRAGAADLRLRRHQPLITFPIYLMT